MSETLVRVPAELVALVAQEVAAYNGDGDAVHIVRAWTRIRDAGLEPGPGLLPYLGRVLEFVHGPQPSAITEDVRRSAVASMLLDGWRPRLLHVLTELSRSMGTRPFTGADVCALSRRKSGQALAEALRAACCNGSAPINGRKVALYFGRMAGRPVNRVRLVAVGKRDNTLIYRVEHMEAAPVP